jgi:hypothetical protein
MQEKHARSQIPVVASKIVAEYLPWASVQIVRLSADHLLQRAIAPSQPIAITVQSGGDARFAEGRASYLAFGAVAAGRVCHDAGDG